MTKSELNANQIRGSYWPYEDKNLLDRDLARLYEID